MHVLTPEQNHQAKLAQQVYDGSNLASLTSNRSRSRLGSATVQFLIVIVMLMLSIRLNITQTSKYSSTFWL